MQANEVEDSSANNGAIDLNMKTRKIRHIQNEILLQ